MYKKSYKQITYIIYDGIASPVFHSQILKPILKMLDESANLEITLISFEHKMPDIEVISSRVPAHASLHLIIAKKLPFFTRLSLRPALWQLIRLFKQIPSNQVIARGPFAAHLAIQTLEYLAKKFPERLRKDSRNKLPKITIQALGLCAEEYKFAQHFAQKKLPQWIRSYIYKQYQQIEFEVYRNKRQTDIPREVAIEAVSPALKEYLVENFRAAPSRIIIGEKDIPKATPASKVKIWKREMRRKLNIPKDAVVYGFIGSAEPWQCAMETIYYFLQKYKDDSKSFLLLLTQERNHFNEILAKSKVPEWSYLVLDVPPDDLYQYLSVCDAGLLFRHRELINWVARPNKMLEYQAVGLPIIHNKTVAWLAHDSNQRNKEVIS